MAKEITLVAEPRDDRGTRPARRLRRAGRLPAVVYGLESDARPITVDSSELGRILHHGGHNALINLVVDGEKHLTLAREIQRHPVRNELVHVDFVRIRADVAVEANVPIHLVGEPEGAKEGGVLEHVLFEVTVTAKPGDIPQGIEIDVSGLNVGDNLKVEDLPRQAGVEYVTELDRVVANLLAPRLAEGPALTPEQLAELEGLSDEELQALAQLAAAAGPEAAPEGEAGEAGAAEGEGGEATEGDGEGE